MKPPLTNLFHNFVLLISNSRKTIFFFSIYLIILQITRNQSMTSKYSFCNFVWMVCIISIKTNKEMASREDLGINYSELNVTLPRINCVKIIQNSIYTYIELHKESYLRFNTLHRMHYGRKCTFSRETYTIPFRRCCRFAEPLCAETFGTR